MKIAANGESRLISLAQPVILLNMPDEADYQEQPTSSAKSVRFVELSSAAMTALLDGSLADASSEAGIALTPYFLADDALRLWRLRVSQIAADPGRARWVARAVEAEPEGVVVGHAGFHGPPDETGMVEVAYSVDPAYRRRGYTRAMHRELLRRAAAQPSVSTVRATIRPGNVGSLATISGFGFAEVGEQWDGEDGRELIFESPRGHRPADPPRPPCLISPLLDEVLACSGSGCQAQLCGGLRPARRARPHGNR
jgi:ribosomal-protein-alanine N-acetyltransferase